MSMAIVKEGDVRLRLRIDGSASFADDVANLGRIVPPRGKGRRAEHREDYCLRRLLVAMFRAGRLKLPLTVEAHGTNDNAYPDFTMRFDDGEVLGIEHRDAGTASWQQWLSSIGESDELAHLHPGEGYVGDAPEAMVTRDVIEAIHSKVTKVQSGAYAAVRHCDLMIYENSESGLLADANAVVERLVAAHRAGELTTGPVAQVHLLFGDLVWLDLFGNRCRRVDISGEYAEDWTGWLAAQARLARDGRIEELDTGNLAEELEALARKERRALRSQLRRLMTHLLKLQYQPERNSRSWLRSVMTAREAIQEILEESPSLEPQLPSLVAKSYEAARRFAARETGLKEEVFPIEPRFTLDELLDDEFYPGAPE